ncbi:MAG: FecR domain-containing protein [Taibaiella sp.]|jgi:ferric-dicitrate binding protein FerR (iron transport regulator)
MTHRINKKAELLLDRYLNNDCTPEERVLVEQWYDNLQLHDKEVTEWAEASKLLFLQKQAGKQTRTKSLVLKRLAAAATLILFAGIGFYFSRYKITAEKAEIQSYAAVTGPTTLKRVLLPDSTVVWLNANSSLKWTSGFTRNVRHVVLKGEASFDVHHDTNHPFIVHTEEVDIKVLGTCFNVETGVDNTATSIALLRGKVEVQSKDTSALKLILLPGEVATYASSEKKISKSKADIQPYFSWMKGGFFASNMPLKHVVEKLCSRYGYTVKWLDNRGGHKHITVSFGVQAFESMLASLCYVNHLQYTINNNVVIIK